MAKKSNKNIKKNENTSRPAASLTDNISAENRAMVPVVDNSGATTQLNEALSGFIFMCSGKTKPECYVNRVFGLPGNKREVVEKIKPGTKLFLFDFDVKLLYGVYEASSNGGMNLQPAAFGGRFPAQVIFKISKDCLPLPVRSFRSAIKDNFQGSKFAPELNGQQVRDLLLLFRPIGAPSSATLHPSVPYGAPEPWVRPQAPNGAPPEPRVRPPAPNGAPPEPRVRHPGPTGGWVNPSLNPRLQNRYRPYPAGPLHNRSQQIMRPQLGQQNGLRPHLHHHQPGPTPGNPYQFAENQQPYPRYMTAREMHPHDQTIGLDGRYNNGLALEPVINHVDRYHGHNPYPMPKPSYGSHLQARPPYNGPMYVHPQPAPSSGPPEVGERSMPVSSFYSFDGAVRLTR